MFNQEDLVLNDCRPTVVVYWNLFIYLVLPLITVNTNQFLIVSFLVLASWLINLKYFIYTFY